MMKGPNMAEVLEIVMIRLHDDLKKFIPIISIISGYVWIKDFMSEN